LRRSWSTCHLYKDVVVGHAKEYNVINRIFLVDIVDIVFTYLWKWNFKL